ncbi:DUF4968 domain-containing protein, partial [candidate division KSB1 bacterium]|nr:DUF4968 domain-containing protein [candidate division KSB1 bacterium]
MKTPPIFKIFFCCFILLTRVSAQPISNITIDGSKLILHSGSDELILKACSDNILKINFLSQGYEDADTLVILKTKWPAVSISFDTSGDPIRMTAPQFVVEISRSPMRMQFYSAANAWLCGEPGNSGMNAGSLILTCPTAHFYGVGNRQTGTLQTTQGGDIRAGAQGGAGAPFAWTTNGWGLLVDSDGGRMDIRANSLAFSRPISPTKRDLECYLLFGKPKEIFAAMTAISGSPPMMPKFTLGFLNTEWGMDEAELRDDVATYRGKNIPIDAYVLDFDWMDWGADQYGEFRWGGKFPGGTSGQLKTDLARLGLKLMGIRKPRIHLDTEQGNFAQTQGFFHSYTTDYFSGKQVGRLNFHLPAAREWYWNAFIQRGNAFATGIIGYWNDEADEYGGNLMFLQMQRAEYEGQRRYTDQRVWSINRNFYLGAQRYAYGHWSGDIATGFSSMDRQRLFMLSSIALGSSWWGMDIGGFNGTPDAENYFRWIQFGAFVPIFRVHGTNGEEREPWNYGAEAEAIATKYIRLRYQLMPYIYSAARQNHLTGLSITRPLVMEYPEDANAADNTAEWLFGESLLIHPITRAS